VNNRYGVDVSYFKKELVALSRSLLDRTPDELSRYLIRLSEVAKPLEAQERRKTVKASTPAQQPQPEICPRCGSSLLVSKLDLLVCSSNDCLYMYDVVKHRAVR
jgi:hypothetical protein